MLVAEVDRLDDESQRRERDLNTLLHVVNIINAPTKGLFQPEQGNAGTILWAEPCEAFLNLIDHPNYLGIVCELIGAAIQLFWAEAIVCPPSPKPANRWHKDGSKPYYFPTVDRRTLLQWVRISFFLTDVGQPDVGAFTVIPGSHRAGFPKLPQGLEHALTITSFTEFQQIEQINAGVPGRGSLWSRPVMRYCFTMHCGTAFPATPRMCDGRICGTSTRCCGSGWETAREFT